MPTKDKSTFSHFFKEDADPIQDTVDGRNGEQIINKVGTANKEIYPTISSSNEISEDDLSEYWKKLRSFFRNDESNEPLPEGLSPVVLSPLYSNKMVGTDYPIWVADENFEGKGDYCISLKKIFEDCLKQIGPNEKDAHILKENLDRIIHIATEQLSDKLPQPFNKAVAAILAETETQLDVKGDELESFNKNIEALKKSLPENGVLLPYSDQTSLQILQAAIFSKHDKARKKLKKKTKKLISKIDDLLIIEAEKSTGGMDAEKLHDSLEFADSRVNFEELSALIPQSGSEKMADDRIERLNYIVKELKKAKKFTHQTGFFFVEDQLFNKESIDWVNLFDTAEVKSYKTGQGSNDLSKSFDEQIAPWTNYFRAKRMAELEIDDNYQDDLHNEFFDHFTWQNLSEEELVNCPYFILIADDVRLFETEYSSLSNMINKNIPAKIITIKHDHFDGDNGVSDLHSQTGFGAIMLSHKNIYVAQSTSIAPKYLFDAFQQGLSTFSPAFFNLLDVNVSINRNPYLLTSASVESRDFPGFAYKGLLGTPWGSRFDVSNNPQANLQFTTHGLNIVDENGELSEMNFPFTFADQAFLNPSYHYHFKFVDPDYWTENLIPITEYLNLKEKNTIGQVPFIWVMDSDFKLNKVAVSWRVVVATQARLDFWRFLQENSGINNYHVDSAVDKAIEEVKAEHKSEIKELRKLQEIEIENTKKDEAGKVMENLTSVLMGLDTSQIIPSIKPVSKPKAGKADEIKVSEAKTEKEEAPPPVPVESVLSNDPYIDTPMCTSCNECINKNDALFKYNTDKMAFIDDPKAGTFLDLVEAAELCPVSIIHPGSPLDPNEPDLEDLIKRAEEYN